MEQLKVVNLATEKEIENAKTNLTSKGAEIFELFATTANHLQDRANAIPYPAAEEEINYKPDNNNDKYEYDTGVHVFLGSAIHVIVEPQKEMDHFQMTQSVSVKGKASNLIHMITTCLLEDDNLRNIFYKAINDIGETDPDKAYIPSPLEAILHLEKKLGDDFFNKIIKNKINKDLGNLKDANDNQLIKD